VTTASQGPPRLLADLDRLDEECTYVHGEPGDGWCRVDQFDGAALDDLLERVMAGPARGRHDAAGSLLAGWLSSAVVGAAGVALVLWQRTWVLDPASTWLRLHPDGWADGIAVAAPVRVCPDDAAGGAVDVEVVRDVAELSRRWAAEAASAMTPILGHLASRARFGLPGMWGGVADGVVGQAVWLASRGGLPADPTWARASRLVEHLADVAPLPPARQRRVAVPWSGGLHHASVRSTCCLHYRTQDRPDPAGEGYCTSCPLRTEPSRVTRLASWLEDHPVAAT
jgi:hypothetical protein